MKTILSFFLLITMVKGYAQKDTLYANQSHNIAIFFPSPIRQATPGSENFTFSYNGDTSQHFGLLQASPGTDSNLIVLTNDGQIYSFALKYRKRLAQTNKFIGIDKSIGHEKQQIKTPRLEAVNDSTIKKAPKKTSRLKKANYFENICSSLLLNRTKNLKSKKKDGMTLRLQNLFYKNREVYLVFEIRNKSGIDFELEYLKVFKVNGNPRRKSSFQKLQLIPVHAYNHPTIINDQTKKRFVYVVPKFTLGDSEKLYFELMEKRGSRILQLIHD